MKSPVIKRSIVIAGHKTSVSLEDAFWNGLKNIATARHTSLSDLVATIDSQRRRGNLSSAIRLFVLDHFQARLAGHDEQERPGAGDTESTGAGDGCLMREHDLGGGRQRGVEAAAPAKIPSLMQPE